VNDNFRIFAPSVNRNSMARRATALAFCALHSRAAALTPHDASRAAAASARMRSSNAAALSRLCAPPSVFARLSVAELEETAGFFEPSLLPALAALDGAMREHGVEGAVGEIGVHTPLAQALAGSAFRHSRPCLARSTTAVASFPSPCCAVRERSRSQLTFLRISTSTRTRRVRAVRPASTPHYGASAWPTTWCVYIHLYLIGIHILIRTRPPCW